MFQLSHWSLLWSCLTYEFPKEMRYKWVFTNGPNVKKSRCLNKQIGVPSRVDRVIKRNLYRCRFSVKPPKSFQPLPPSVSRWSLFREQLYMPNVSKILGAFYTMTSVTPMFFFKWFVWTMMVKLDILEHLRQLYMPTCNALHKALWLEDLFPTVKTSPFVKSVHIHHLVRYKMFKGEKLAFHANSELFTHKQCRTWNIRV